MHAEIWRRTIACTTSPPSTTGDEYLVWDVLRGRRQPPVALLTKVRTLIHEEISLLTVLYFPFRARTSFLTFGVVTP